MSKRYVRACNLLQFHLLPLNLLQLVFSSAQTYTLSHYVLQLMPSSTAPSTTDFTEQDRSKKQLEEELLSMLRLSLVKNLSRALVEENTKLLLRKLAVIEPFAFLVDFIIA